MSRTSLARTDGVRDSTEQRVTENYAATYAKNLYDKEVSDRATADNKLQENIEAKLAQAISDEATARAEADDDVTNKIGVKRYLASDGDGVRIKLGEIAQVYNDTMEPYSLFDIGGSVVINPLTWKYVIAEDCINYNAPIPYHYTHYRALDVKKDFLNDSLKSEIDQLSKDINTEVSDRAAADETLQGFIDILSGSLFGKNDTVVYECISDVIPPTPSYMSETYAEAGEPLSVEVNRIVVKANDEIIIDDNYDFFINYGDINEFYLGLAVDVANLRTTEIVSSTPIAGGVNNGIVNIPLYHYTVELGFTSRRYVVDRYTGGYASVNYDTTGNTYTVHYEESKGESKTLADLNTTDKSNIIAAINEIAGALPTYATSIKLATVEQIQNLFKK